MYNSERIARSIFILIFFKNKLYVNSHQNVELNINIMLYLMFIFLGMKIFIVIGMILKYIQYKKLT